ncbi:MAG TPA: TetR/AcrR family transcriptional regulator [Firmicutes bacterium]|nr:TetR/AcrR family transcriptional regulator [Bacillota bacterium]
MPKDTFFNLPEEKRQKIIDAAIDEFGQRSFYDARITAVVEAAGIAKGSFYQYFEDKMDLFKYIVGLIAEKKMAYLNKNMMLRMEDYSFFQLLRELFLSGFRFAKENPRLVLIGLQLLNNPELFYQVIGAQQDLAVQFYEKLLEKGMADGDLDPKIDVKIAARILTGMTYSLADLIYEDGVVDLDDMEIVDHMLYIVENGLKKRPDARDRGGCPDGIAGA